MRLLLIVLGFQDFTAMETVCSYYSSNSNNNLTAIIHIENVKKIMIPDLTKT